MTTNARNDASQTDIRTVINRLGTVEFLREATCIATRFQGTQRSEGTEGDGERSAEDAFEDNHSIPDFLS